MYVILFVCGVGQAGIRPEDYADIAASMLGIQLAINIDITNIW